MEMTTIRGDSTIAAVEDLTSADLGGEAIVLDLKAGRYYGLNEVGARILELVQEPRTVRELVELLLEEYDVSAEQLEKDVLHFVEKMERQHLVSVMG